MKLARALVCLGLATPAAAQPLDVREPPFPGDFSWLHGSNRQPSSLLQVGVLTFSLYVDTYFQIQLHNPMDHTVFPTTVAPRHNEASLNLASIGVTLPPNAIDTKAGSPLAELDLQYGAMVETVMGQDTTTQRGFFLTQRAFAPIRTATAGWHFHWMHGANVEVGIFPSFIGLDSYLTQENWHYLHPFAADFTPYYFSAARVQAYPSRSLALSLWAINGWQTFGQWHEAGGAAYTVIHRPGDRFTISNGGYIGPEIPSDESILRLYEDTTAQVLLHRQKTGALRSIALAGLFDVGFDTAGRTRASSARVGGVLSGRFEWANGIATALRADTYWDEGQALVPPLPPGSPYTRPQTNTPFFGTGLTATIDYLPSPWLLVRLEYMHRAANIPLFSGQRGITGPDGKLPADEAAKSSFVPDLRYVDDRGVLALILRL